LKIINSDLLHKKRHFQALEQTKRRYENEYSKTHKSITVFLKREGKTWATSCQSGVVTSQIIQTAA